MGRVRPYLDDGRAICLCPGTASWNRFEFNLKEARTINEIGSANFSLAGCPEAALCNILTAVQVASQSRTLGIVVASWSGPHHLTPHPFSWPGFVVAAGLSWNTSTHWVGYKTICIELFLKLKIAQIEKLMPSSESQKVSLSLFCNISNL